MLDKNDIVQCIRCNNKHLFSERISVVDKKGWTNSTCPRCGAKPMYKLNNNQNETT